MFALTAAVVAEIEYELVTVERRGEPEADELAGWRKGSILRETWYGGTDQGQHETASSSTLHTNLH